MLSERMRDTGVSVRKRVIKLLRELALATVRKHLSGLCLLAYLVYRLRQPGAPRTAQLCRALVGRIHDEPTVRADVVRTFEALWFAPVDAVVSAAVASSSSASAASAAPRKSNGVTLATTMDVRHAAVAAPVSMRVDQVTLQHNVHAVVDDDDDACRLGVGGRQRARQTERLARRVALTSFWCVRSHHVRCCRLFKYVLASDVGERALSVCEHMAAELVRRVVGADEARGVSVHAGGVCRALMSRACRATKQQRQRRPLQHQAHRQRVLMRTRVRSQPRLPRCSC
jgi:hypothetical protein